MSFLTITLPAFGKAFERALDAGSVSSTMIAGFASDRRGLPRFLGGFLRNVFDEHGALLDSTPLLVDSIDAIRQLTGMFAKIELPCTDARTARAIRGYVDADQDTGNWDDTAHAEILQDLTRVSTLLFGSALARLDKAIWDGDVTPKHGPGAVAERLRGNAKFDLVEWPERLERVFRYAEYATPSLGHEFNYRARLDRVQFQPEEQERPSRMCLVPKTLKSPRVIAAEPAALQYMQQAIAGRLVPLLETSPVVGPMIGFTDQLPNQELARQGSRNGDLATLDMSEASDRVSVRQVNAVLARFPWVMEAVHATRSRSVELPDGSIHRIRKFASMGSALCFPMEAMAFLAAVFVGIERATASQRRASHLTPGDIKSFHGAVRVYGDDIIVPVGCVDEVIKVFTLLGWKTNADKSFWTGKFRESCGGDFYDGHWVTPVRVRRMIPRHLSDSTADVVSLVSLRNQLYERGWWKTAGYLDRLIGGILPHYPVVAKTASVLGRVSYLVNNVGERWNLDLHVPEVKGYVVRPKIPRSNASGEGLLLKCLLASYESSDHLEFAGRPVAVDMKLRWTQPW